MKEFFKYIFIFEKPRWYSGGALKYPVRITQRFWDKLKARQDYFKNNVQRGVDTNLGVCGADIGERPVVPDWIVELRSNILFIISILSFSYLLSVFIRHY